METILKRVVKVAEINGITLTKLESKIGASKGVLSRALQNNTDIQSKWIIRIVENYPEINTEWLLIGIGEILKENHIFQNNISINDYIELQKKHIRILENEIEDLKLKLSKKE